MKINRLVALFPCQNLDDFELQQTETDAEELLSAWTVLWHPALLAAATKIPGWVPAASPPTDEGCSLIIVPSCCESLLPADWLLQAEAAGACVLRGLRDCDAMLAVAAERLGLKTDTVDGDLAADFMALGYCHLQVELIARRSYYMTSLDSASLETAALTAAGDAMRGDSTAPREHLQAAFDRLHEAREYSCPTEPRLLDLTLLAPSTLGATLREELTTEQTGTEAVVEVPGTEVVVAERPEAGDAVSRQPPPSPSPRKPAARNLMASGAVIAEMAAREPETLEALKRALAGGGTAIVGGEFAETPLSLLDPEAIRSQLLRGLQTYQQHLQRRPTVFGRRRFGLTAILPPLLERLQFAGALHFTLDDGRFPAGKESRIQWEGIDGTTIESLAAVPLDAGRAQAFLSLAETLQSAINLNHSATIIFAHWPGRASRWYDALRRIAAYGTVLGRFYTIGAYFEETGYSGHRSHYAADEYRCPYLRQDVAAGRRDPISRWVRYFGHRAVLTAWEAAHTLAVMLKGKGGRGKGEENDDCGMMKDELAGAIDDALDGNQDDRTSLDERLKGLLNASAAEFAAAITSQHNAATDGSAEPVGLLVVNPWSFSQQACIHPSSLIPHSSSQTVDVPSMGFAWLGDVAETPAALPPARKGWFGGRKPKRPPPLAEPHLLRNEFCEVHFDPHTGAIQAIGDYHSRDPRLAQQIALRLPQGGQPDDESNYSIMAADDISVTSAGPVLGEIVSRGRLMDRQGRRMAGFRQTTRVWRGSRMIDLSIDLDIDRRPEPNPWESYYAVRFAWKDETATLVRSVNMAGVPTELTQFESPYFVDLRRPRHHTTVLCGGLPYHRRVGPRKLDTLLVVHGETAQSFRLGIGIDVPHPLSAALGLLAPPVVVPGQPLPDAPSGWLFHLDCRNVLATHWEPLEASAIGNNAPTDSRRLTAAGRNGVRVRLLETEGRGVQLHLRCFRPVQSARKVNPGDVPPTELTVAGDRVEAFIGPHQWIELEVEFTR